MANLKLEIVTPAAQIFSGEVEFVQIPAAEGEMGIFPQHEALVTELNAGTLSYRQTGQTQSLAIGQGFAEITGTGVVILTDGALEEEKIDEGAAEAAVKRAQELLQSNSLEGDELELTQANLARALAQLGLKRHRHVG